MKRRTLLKAVGLGGLGLGLGFRNSYALQLGGINLSSRLDPVHLPSTPVDFNNFPRVINIFLYGGPSELAGNLSNIEEINDRSKNKYTSQIGDMLNSVTLDAQGNPTGQLTANNFWRSAGGESMETMLKAGVMSVYRTMSRNKSHDLKAHRESVIQNQLGSFDLDRAGTASVLSELLRAHVSNNTLTLPSGKKDVGDLIFPFVSFDSQAQWFAGGDIQVATALKPVALGENITNNPYIRSGVSGITLNSQESKFLDELVGKRDVGAHAAALRKAFLARDNMQQSLTNLIGNNSNNKVAQLLTETNTIAGNLIDYRPNNVGNIPLNPFGQKIQSAVSLMLLNPETLYAAVGGGAMGGWDDHSGALEGGNSYPNSMQNLMDACLAAMVQIKAAAALDPVKYGHANSIIINIYGDFGRNVDLNDGLGWDHGNNQNLYTFGGRAFRSAALGKIVGTTSLDLSTSSGRMFTMPDKGSYTFEPFALASTLYQYYGVTNPEVLNDGVSAIDASQGSTPVDWTPRTSTHASILNFLQSN